MENLEIIEVNQEIIDSMKARISQKSENKNVYFNIYEDCLDIEE